MDSEWNESFWGCCSPVGTCTCSLLYGEPVRSQHIKPVSVDLQETNHAFCTGCMATWCGCCLFGKTKYRRQNPSMTGYSTCNGPVRVEPLPPHNSETNLCSLLQVPRLVRSLLLRLTRLPPMVQPHRPARSIPHRRQWRHGLSRQRVLSLLRARSRREGGR